MTWFVAAIGFALKLWALFKKPKASPESVAAANAAEERTVAQVDAATATTEAAIAQAVVDAPQTKDQLVDQLRRGGF